MDEERNIGMNRYITKEEFLKVLDNINFSHIKMCEIELIHCFKVEFSNDNTQNLVPITTDFRLNY